MTAPSEKEKILGRIREALKISSPQPHHGAAAVSSRATPREWLPRVGSTMEELQQDFEKNASILKAEVRVVQGLSGAIEFLAVLKAAGSWKRCGIHSGNLTTPVSQALAVDFCRTDGPYSSTELEACEVGITECDALIAQTGSVLVTSQSAGGRALSVLPPHHVVLATREQLLPDLTEALLLLQKRYAGNYPSFISFITGPSRTGDIERILVLGAHGPKRLTIVIIG
jgi:L-lactate dehydrogenase complex protein LldG